MEVTALSVILPALPPLCPMFDGQHVRTWETTFALPFVAFAAYMYLTNCCPFLFFAIIMILSLSLSSL